MSYASGVFTVLTDEGDGEEYGNKAAAYSEECRRTDAVKGGVTSKEERSQPAYGGQCRYGYGPACVGQVRVVFSR